MRAARSGDRSAFRRLGFCILVLAAVDRAVPSVVRVSEQRRYESDVQVRFENSDLFLLGPLTAYLREHPQGTKPRVVFFGDSVVWGYFVKPHEAIPAAFQRLTPGVRVLNFGINGFQSGSAYLITKAIVDAVDVVYLFDADEGAHPMLPKLIEVDADDAARFGLSRPSRFEQLLDRLTGSWALHRYSYRLQAAWFGTSTRQYLHLHKGEWVRGLLGHRAAEDPGALAEAPADTAQWAAPRLRGPVTPEAAERVASAHRLLWDYALLLAGHRKHGVIIEMAGHHAALTEEEQRIFNARFHPYVLLATLGVPDAWLMKDRVHFTPEGTRGVAEALRRHTAAAMGIP
jgi:lysophospholipase L1-like esterase